MEELNYTIKSENDSLKEKNQTLFRKTKNQQRTILRLKKIIEKQNSFLKKAKENKLEDDEWEDLDVILNEAESN